MTVFELVGQEVTARQVAEAYGLKFDRSGRGYCPWHDDRHHAALKFFGDGRGCYCHACHKYGDAVSLAAQMLGLGQKEAAEQICRDFHLDAPVDNRPDPTIKVRARQKRDREATFNRCWAKLCDFARECDGKLARYAPETMDAEFDRILAAKAAAETKLDMMWEAARGEKR